MGKGRMRRVSRYSNEFKITAIRLASLPGTPGVMLSNSGETYSAIEGWHGKDAIGQHFCVSVNE